MSNRTTADSVENRKLASFLQSSVLPTPVGPRKKNDARGLFSPLSPARCMRTALATALRASSWPRTDSRRESSMWMSFSACPEVSLDTGMPVTRDTTAAISSAVTDSWIKVPSPVDSGADSPSLGSLASSDGMTEYLSSPARPKLFSR